MRTLLIADIHIEDNAIEEIDSIFENDICKLKADRIIQLGDLFDKNRPTPNELKFTTHLINKLIKQYKDVTLLAGNGSHEFLNGVAVIEYMKELGAKIIPKDHFVQENIYYGHHMLHESMLEYGSGKCGLKDLKQYNYSILAHQHNFQKFNDKVYHLGSIRYQNFNEASDENKYVAILTDNKELELIALKSPIKMKDFYSLVELEKADKNIKARLCINSFEQFKKSINEIHKYKLKFSQFKVKLDFEEEKVELEKADNSNKKLEEILQEGIAQVKDVEVREMLQKALE